MLQCIQIKVIASGALWNYVYQVCQYAAQLSEKAIESWDTCGGLRKGSYGIDSDKSCVRHLPAEA